MHFLVNFIIAAIVLFVCIVLLVKIIPYFIKEKFPARFALTFFRSRDGFARGLGSRMRFTIDLIIILMIAFSIFTGFLSLTVISEILLAIGICAFILVVTDRFWISHSLIYKDDEEK